MNQAIEQIIYSSLNKNEQALALVLQLQLMISLKG